MKQASAAVLLAVLGAVALGANDASDRDKLIGSWVSIGDGPATTWTFNRKGDVLQVTESEGGNKVADYKCGVDGKTCQTKVSGKKADVSMWYLGPKLVELEIKGSEVIQRRFAVLPPGNLIELEIVPIVSETKPETLRLKKVELSAQTK